MGESYAIDPVRLYLVLGTAAVCVVALVGTVAVAATDGLVGAAGWARPGADPPDQTVGKR